MELISQYRPHAQPIAEISPVSHIDRVHFPNSALAQGEILVNSKSLIASVVVSITSRRFRRRRWSGDVRVRSFSSR